MLSGLCVPQFAGAVMTRQGGDVASSQARLAEARAAYDESVAALPVAEARYRQVADNAVVLEADLRVLDRQSLNTVLAYEATLSRARELAVSAYVRGGAHADLESFLDADAATDVVLRRHLVIGRVDRAQEAASELRTQRVLVDSEAREVGAQVAAMASELGDAEAGLYRARDREQQAYADLLAAIDDLRVREGEAAAAQAAAEAAAATARRAEDERSARTPSRSGSSGGSGGSGGSGPSTTVPKLPDDGQAAAWAYLLDCESGGDYTIVSSDGLYRGGYQFSQPTWESVGGVGDPAAASPAEQDYRARLLYERGGAGQWPLCGRYLR